MVLLPGCGCCGGGEPYTCWRDLDNLICKPTSDGAPGPEYVAVDQYDNSGGCIQCQVRPVRCEILVLSLLQQCRVRCL